MTENKDSTLVNTKKEDFLDEDKVISGQKYCLLSFISPEDILINKESYYLTKFFDKLSKDIDTLFNGIISKYPDSEELINNIKENHNYISNVKEMDEQYKFVKASVSSEVEADYHRDNDFKTTMRGIKIRGSFDSIEEARNRSEFLKRTDPNFNIYIAQVGCWCPWSPNPNDLENQEYSETQLNTLMKQYKKNMSDKDEVFEKRKQSHSLTNTIISEEEENDINDSSSELTENLDKLDPWSQSKGM
tara:strand:+ start:510 stop:1247 length:738 start_codon:yes stop_codon:yes gene_type:complete